MGATLTVDPPTAFASVFPGGSITVVPERWSAPPSTPLSTNHGASGADHGLVGPDGHHGAWNILIRTMQVRHGGGKRVADVLAEHHHRKRGRSRDRGSGLEGRRAPQCCSWGSRTSTRGRLRIAPLRSRRAPARRAVGPSASASSRCSGAGGQPGLLHPQHRARHHAAGHDVHVMQGRAAGSRGHR